MSTDLDTRPTVIDGELVPNRPNPHTAPLWITATALVATAASIPHTAAVDPTHLGISAGASLAATGLFLYNLVRRFAYEDKR